MRRRGDLPEQKDGNTVKFPKQNLIRDKAYLKWVRSQPCCITGRMGDDIDPAHIRYGLGGGVGLKSSDDTTLPLSNNLHRYSHDIGEISFWLEKITPDLLMRSLKALARENYRNYLEEK